MISAALVALSLTQGLPPAVDWMSVLSSEDGQIEVARQSIVKNPEDFTVEMVLRRTFKAPIQTSGGDVHFSIESVFIMCTLKSMVVSTQSGFDERGTKVYENVNSKLYRARNEADHIPTMLIDGACASMVRPKPQPQKPSAQPKFISVLNPKTKMYI